MKFGLSTLISLVAFCAIAIAWWSDRSNLVAENEALHRECAELFSNQSIVLDSGGRNLVTGGHHKIDMYDASDVLDRANYHGGRPPKLLSATRTSLRDQ